MRDHGAKGDGTHDDSTAILSAVAALKSDGSLYFPLGSYRFAQQKPVGGAAISITGISNFDIDFDTGAELVMDNLDSTGAGTSHGILVRGPSSGVTLRNIKVRWATQPASRSRGDGIRIVGYPTARRADPGAARSITGVSISNCEIVSSPQAGVIMMGVSDITVSGLRVRDTMADGLHFNACRRAKVSGYSGTNTGDDGLALVTYYDDVFRFDPASETFAFPNLTDWSNSDFTIKDVEITGGRANGVRLSGVNGATLSGLTVRGHESGSGVMIDSATKASGAGWYYVASRGVHLDQIVVERCETGLQILARPIKAIDDRFTAFDLNVSDATMHGCSNWALRAESLTSRPLSGLNVGSLTADSTSTTRGSGAVGLENTVGVSMTAAKVTHDQPVPAFVAVNSRQLNIGNLRLAFTGKDGPRTPGPCASFLGSDGRIGSIDVSWPSAPASWTAVEIVSRTECSEETRPESSPVKIGQIIVDPSSVVSPVNTC